MQDKRNRPVSAAKQRLPLFPDLQERSAFRTIVLPFKAKERNMAVPGVDVRYNASNALQTLAHTSNRLKGQFEELQHLREAVAEASGPVERSDRRLSGYPEILESQARDRSAAFCRTRCRRFRTPRGVHGAIGRHERRER
jgi:hypothetical protein